MEQSLLADVSAEHVRSDKSAQKGSTRDACLLMSGIIAASVVSIGLAAYCSLTYKKVLSHAFLAFMLGLRHAVDCDHLAAIDNVTRQFTKRGERPVSIGFWFALGHSTVVVALTGFIVGGYSLAWKHFHNDTNWTDDVALTASIISITLLGGIGFLNARVAIELITEWRRVRERSISAQEDV
jgi:high-affinity nickel permease